MIGVEDNVCMTVFKCHSISHQADNLNESQFDGRYHNPIITQHIFSAWTPQTFFGWSISINRILIHLSQVFRESNKRLKNASSISYILSSLRCVPMNVVAPKTHRGSNRMKWTCSLHLVSEWGLSYRICGVRSVSWFFNRRQETGDNPSGWSGWILIALPRHHHFEDWLWLQDFSQFLMTHCYCGVHAIIWYDMIDIYGGNPFTHSGNFTDHHQNQSIGYDMISSRCRAVGRHLPGPWFFHVCYIIDIWYDMILGHEIITIWTWKLIPFPADYANLAAMHDAISLLSSPSLKSQGCKVMHCQLTVDPRYCICKSWMRELAFCTKPHNRFDSGHGTA